MFLKLVTVDEQSQLFEVEGQLAVEDAIFLERQLALALFPAFSQYTNEPLFIVIPSWEMSTN